MLKQVLARLDRPTRRYPVLALVSQLPAAVLANITNQFVRSYPIGYGMELRDEIWSMEGCPPTPMRSVYSTRDSTFVGELAWAKRLVGYGVVPELSRPTNSVCSVGFSRRRQSWFGWSHRAQAEFAVGDRLFDPDYGDDSTLFSQHGTVTITTLDQARQAAVAFADYVG